MPHRAARGCHLNRSADLQIRSDRHEAGSRSVTPKTAAG
jgi:hypothetical protein